MSTHIVIPDSHAHPDYNNERYSLLGQLIADVKPDVVIDIGDFWDMASLCSYDRGKRSFQGRSYAADIAAGVEAQDRIKTVLAKRKRKLPRFVRCLGNHEQRIDRALDLDPVLVGTIGYNDLQSKEYGWDERPFLEVVNIDGVDYSHYFVTGVSGRPISGEHPAYTLLTKRFKSSTQGHVHTFDFCRRAAGDQRLNGLVCGVFQDYDADYAGQANNIWDAGVAIKRNVENGNYDLEWVSITRLRQEYGGG